MHTCEWCFSNFNEFSRTLLMVWYEHCQVFGVLQGRGARATRLECVCVLDVNREGVEWALVSHNSGRMRDGKIFSPVLMAHPYQHAIFDLREILKI